MALIIDIIPLSPEEYGELTVVQMQLLRTAQKKKNEMKKNLDDDIATFHRKLMENGVENSSLYEDKKAALTAEYERQLEIIIEQLEYAMTLNEPIPDDDADKSAPYIVDYTLSYNERYILVRDYYLSIQDPSERLNMYTNDAVARRYLDSYYSALWSLLYKYSME